MTVQSLPKDASGKSKYFEGTPIPFACLSLELFMAVWVAKGWILDDIPLGVWGKGEMWEFHPVVGLFVVAGCLMTSKTLHVPKP